MNSKSISELLEEWLQLESKRTPGEWEGDWSTFKFDASDGCIGEMYAEHPHRSPGQTKNNRDFVVRAANTYKPLVSALLVAVKEGLGCTGEGVPQKENGVRCLTFGTEHPTQLCNQCKAILKIQTLLNGKK